MIQLFNRKLDENSIIDIVVPPTVRINEIVRSISENFNHIVIIDTQGNLYEEYKNALWMIGNENSQFSSSSDSESFENLHNSDNLFNLFSKRVDYSFVESFEDFKFKIESLKNYKNFVLIIDTITFVCDISSLSIKSINVLLWSIIYKTNSTIVTINHYRVNKQNEIVNFVPRMGKYWSTFVSYQILFRNIFNQLTFSVNENLIENY